MKADLSRFLYENGISRKEIAEYLGVSSQFVSMVCNGKCQLSGRLYNLIVNNDRGWNTDCLSAEPSVEVKELIRQLKEKDSQIEYLLKTIVNLTEK